MSLETLFLMRHEMILLGIILVLLIGEIFKSNNSSHLMTNAALVLFGIHTIVGFLPLADANLFGGMFQTNAMVNFFKNILNVGVFILILQAADWIKLKMTENNKSSEFFLLLFASLLGVYYMISAGDFLMFYLGLELSTLPVAVLVAYNATKKQSSEAGIKLILSAALASGTALFGISLLYAATGSIYFSEVTAQLISNPLTILGAVLFVTGLAFKISLVPFHFWTADVYEGAPVSVASYLSVISKGAAVFILMILLFNVLKPLVAVLDHIIYVIALLTMFVGNLFALRQDNIQRFLAYSSIAQAGFILLGLLEGNQLGTATVVYFVMIYIFSNLAAFGVAGSIALNSGKKNISDYKGLYRSNPKLSLVMMLALFSLAGIPPVAGFFGKFFLFTAAASKGYYLLVFLAVVNVTISLYYYLLVIKAMFLTKSEQPIPFFKSQMLMRIGLIITVVGILVLGLYSPLYDYIYELSSILN